MADETTLTRVCSAEDVPLNEVRRFDLNGARVAVFHLDDGFYALGDTCSHEEASLSEGFVEDEQVECPKHGATFDIRTGRNCTLPATRPVPAYRVSVENGEVYVEVPHG